MNAIVAIAKRDFRSLVSSPMFVVIAALCAVLWSFLYLRMLFNFAGQLAVANFRGGTAGMNINYQLFIQHISYVHLIFIFAIPAITMRLISEEKRQRSYDLLLTAPITASQIALGKFFGGLSAVFVLILLSFLYPAATAFFAKFSWAPLLTSYAGLLLAAGFYVAVGLFASSLTESPMLSVILGMLFNLTVWFVGSAQETVENEAWTAVLNHISIGQQFYSFLRGTVTISALVFFISTIGFFVFLSQRVIESSRWR